MSKQDKDIQKIIQLLRESAKLDEQARKLGIKYIDKYCKYKPGMKILMKPQYGQREFGIIRMVHFDINSEMKSFCKLYVTPCTKEWAKKDRRSTVRIENDTEILELIKQSEQ